MAVAYDAFSKVTAPATGNISWTHTPVGTPKGVIVWVVSNGGYADEVTSVTYGGVSMTQASSSPSLANLAEDSSVHCFFLGSSVPTGAQTVAVTTSASAQTNLGYCVTVTAATASTALQNNIAFTDNATVDNPSTTLTLGGATCFVAESGQSGVDSVTGITLTGWNARNETDFGTQCGFLYTYSTIASSDVSVGIEQTADDLNLIAVAVREDAGSVTATFSVAIGTATANSAGSIAVAATSATSTTAATVSSAGGVAVTATSAPSTTAATVAASASVAGTFRVEVSWAEFQAPASTAVTASAAVTLGAITASADVVVVDGPIATLAATIGAITASSAAAVAVDATSAVTVDAVTSSSVGAVAVDATSTPTIAAVTVSAGATVADGPIATLAATIDAVTVSSAATVAVAATSAVTVDEITASAAATVAVVATSTPTVGAVTLASAASVTAGPEAALASEIGPITLASTATVAVLAAGAATYGSIVLESVASNGEAPVVPVRGVVPAGGVASKKHRKPKSLRRVQIGDKDYIVSERAFPAFMEAMVRRQPLPTSVEVEQAATRAPAAKVASATPAKAKRQAKAAPALEPLRFVIDQDPVMPDLRAAVEEHRPDLMPQFWSQAVDAYIDQRVAAAVRQYVDTAVAPALSRAIAEVRDDVEALGVMLD